jgi:hypothetical protein
VNPLFSLSKKKRRAGAEIEDGDLWALADQDTTASLRSKFETGWKRGVARAKLKKNSAPTDDNAPQSLTDEESYGALVSALWTVGGKGFKNAGFVKLVSTTVDLSMPVLINLVLTFIARSTQPNTEDIAMLAAWEANKPAAWEGYALAAGIGLATLVQSLADDAYIHSTWRVAYQVRSSVTTAVYRKSLTLSSASRQGKTVGEIVNFMQLDAERMGRICASWRARDLVLHVHRVGCVCESRGNVCSLARVRHPALLRHRRYDQDGRCHRCARQDNQRTAPGHAGCQDGGLRRELRGCR